MTQLGEGVDVGVFVSDDKTHSKATCPWHEEPEDSSADPMELQLVDEDSHGPIPANLGKKLGDNLRNAEDPPPDADTVEIAYDEGATIAFKLAGKNKKVQTYRKVNAEVYEYPLQYAPHHLIPGNESLKGSDVLVFMGDDSVIKGYEPTEASLIKKGRSIGYDVNADKNGVWLPSPYALSNSNKWPSQDGIKVIFQRLGQVAVDEAESFKSAYVAASIRASGGRQFHMRHEDYSYKVQEILNAMGDKINLLATKCPVAKDSKEDDLFEPPAGLKGKLNALSSRMKTLLTGVVWRSPFFADHLSSEYADSLKRARRSSKALKELKVM
jgi:hypothetical protein